ncbi:beta-1,3-galactosyltransferase 1-like [Patiria miniata]|uniref:Hexosyltransferase n=1 Tax=Patiria miniata TaxID=46514 RepID=A0A913ZYU1_PATMI|nr:beta-1,3-galactosyltransferase 1-like [Patiria miniata]
MYVARLKRVLLPVLVVLAIVVLTRVFRTDGPASVLKQIDTDWKRFTHLSHKDSMNGTTSRRFTQALNYTERLRAAYAPTTGHVNPHNFRLVLDEPWACLDPQTESAKRVFLLVLVASAQDNFKRRQAIRETWGSPRELEGLPVVTLFLLAAKGNVYHHKVVKESAEHHDLLMEDFVDSYKNLTLKTMMAMKWASTHCPQASFVMKTDDDMFVSYRNLLDYAAVMGPFTANLALGFVIAGQSPIRKPDSKWYMPRDLYPGDAYPPWLSGGGFVVSGDVPGKVYDASLDIRYLHLEDVFVGVCLDKLNIKPIMNRQFSNSRIKYSYCRFRYVITAHSYDTVQLKFMWEDLLVEKPCWLWT